MYEKAYFLPARVSDGYIIGLQARSSKKEGGGWGWGEVGGR